MSESQREPRDPATGGTATGDDAVEVVPAGKPTAGEPTAGATAGEPAGEPAAEEVPDATPDDPETTRFVEVTRRRAPRYRSFVLTGVVLAFLVAAVVAVVTPAQAGYSQQSLFGYLFVSLGILLALLGGLAAVLLERRRTPRGASRRSRRG
ncbi:hypothetical protein [Kineococcus sp. SYSU DK004]|uniref:hypothetical protein n=1 Tax=Kineococcus sp. SYSU DK004 TaxID=3383125 RepID=UPI003D7E9AC0